LEAYARQGCPVTLVTPSTTDGPTPGRRRQIAWDVAWLDRMRQGKPLLICGDGTAVPQHVHGDAAALGCAPRSGRPRCMGQLDRLVDRGGITRAAYPRTAMRGRGRQVERVGVPLAELMALHGPHVEIGRAGLAQEAYDRAAKLFRDVPACRPVVS
jgi:hypothetical protein